MMQYKLKVTVLSKHESSHGYTVSNIVISLFFFCISLVFWKSMISSNGNLKITWVGWFRYDHYCTGDNSMCDVNID